MKVLRLGDALALAALTVGLATAANAMDVVGTQVTLGWAPASGPVSGYYVVVSRNAGAAQLESVTIEPQKSLSGSVGETIVVQVAAFGADGVAGPVSPPSDPITFVADTSGGTPPPPDDGSGSEPPPDDGGTGSGPTVGRDFNGDGTADLVVRSGSTMRIWAIQGASVTSEVALPSAPSGSSVVGTGDYDGNGSADLLWENTQTGALALWLLEGGSVASTAVLDRSSLPAAEEWHVGGSGDVDGDGADDLMLWSRVAGEVEIWTFSGASIASRSRLSGNTGAWSVVAVDDTDGDGMAEIVWFDELDRALELRDPSAADPVTLGSLSSGWRGRGAFDFAGDTAARLLMHHPESGAAQAWAVDDGGVLGSIALPNAQGRYSGSGDFDGNGTEDVVWSNPFTGVVTLWLGSAGGVAVATLDRKLAAGSEIVSGATGSDDGAFRERFCSGDFDENGAVDGVDFNTFTRCYQGQLDSICDRTDMDSDGAISSTDFAIFKLRFSNKECEPW